MDNRDDIQKIETEFPVAFFLFRHGERHKNANLVYAYCPLVAQCNQGIIQKQKSIFDRSGTYTDTPDKPFRLDVDRNEGEACLYQAQDKTETRALEPYNCLSFEGG